MTHPLLAALSAIQLAVTVSGVLACVILYLGYKLLYHADFGMPVRRRLFVRRMRVRRDQYAEVPIWWSNVQVQHAIKGHWKQSLRRGAQRPGGGAQA